MNKRIDTRLKCMADWFESETINYTKEDLKRDTNRIMDAIHEAEFVDIITVKQANELTDLVVRRIGKYM